jgi:hypothetical protein
MVELPFIGGPVGGPAEAQQAAQHAEQTKYDDHCAGARHHFTSSNLIFSLIISRSSGSALLSSAKSLLAHASDATMAGVVMR